MTNVLVERKWRSDILGSVEHFTLRSDRDGYKLAGTTDVVTGGRSLDLKYEVSTDMGWLTTAVEVRSEALDIRYHLDVTSGRKWTINGDERHDFVGSTDIDLGWTPATNTMPIRRFDVRFGTPIEVEVVWLRWPELVFERAQQTYARKSETNWTYRQGDFAASLITDSEGVVKEYGSPPIWSAIPVD